MAEVVLTGKILKNKGEIKLFLGISDYIFEQYRKEGMPMNKVNGQWIGHADNINNWWLKRSNYNCSKISDEQENGGEKQSYSDHVK